MAKVLIVDDDPFARQLMRDSLSLSGDDHEIVEVERGRLALEVIAAERPDLVLLDIALPELDGIPICAVIKRRPATSAVRIIIVSAHTGPDCVATCLREGASAYVTKPFQPADLVREVRRVLADKVAA